MTSSLTDQQKNQIVSKVWMPAAAPLMTRWAKDVSPNSARPEYPRPAAVRSRWKLLNGIWDLAIEEPGEFAEKILVPFVFESALSGIGKGKEVHEHLTYRRTFDIPPTWAGKRVLLHFGAVDWEAIVFVNGHEVGRHRGGYTPFSFDITDVLSEGGEQVLEVQVFDPAAYDPHAFGLIPRQQAAYQPMGKQLGSMGIWYTRSTGIWQSVWLEPVHESHISDFHLLPNVATSELQVVANVPGSADNLLVRIYREGHLVGSGSAEAKDGKVTVSCVVTDCNLWTPETPNLYDVTLTLKRNRLTVDRIRTYCAFRSISVVDGHIALNGQPYMMRAVLDQGYWPDGIYTAPTEQALTEDLIQAKAMGFNTIRKHAKVEEQRFYYLCDRMGLLVVQDMPSSQDLSSREAKANYLNEWAETVRTLWNHPCVALWVPFNENWGNPGEFQDEVVDFTKMLDSTRLVVDASGWTQRLKTDVFDFHDYTNNLTQYSRKSPTIPQWVGEYGGIACPIEGHTWMKWWGYQSVKTPSKLLQKAKFLTNQILQGEGFSGFCFTQLCDVEQELNGLMTYDRIPKAPLEKFAQIFDPTRFPSLPS